MNANKLSRVVNPIHNITGVDKKELRLKLAALENRLGQQLISSLILSDTQAVVEITP
ncbi:hypothetical protein EDC56_1279 [Sinobacterium caligoides]|uniref:Uncharacterized protein n=1 Tax=Sinobacterium caligoides TaxID=933926 RepID=A0A3N2E213_9GAMM|nr:hypothetical protein EDC56_1279 [Sinobacterium caligoides]